MVHIRHVGMQENTLSLTKLPKASVPKLLAQVTIAALLAIGAIVASDAVVGNDDYCKYMPRFEIQPRLKDSPD